MVIVGNTNKMNTYIIQLYIESTLDRCVKKVKGFNVKI